MSTKQTFDFSVDLLQSLLWQHNEAQRLESLVRAKNDWYARNHSDFWSSWLRDVFDLRTANAFGLQVWSIILGIPLQVALPPAGVLNKFGFGTFNRNFNRGNFGGTSSSSSGLPLEQARQLLRLRYFTLVTRPCTLEINAMLSQVFAADGPVYAVETNNMRMTYVFGFILNRRLQSMLLEFDVLPRPAAVGIDLLFVRRKVFGFGEYNGNFNSTTFAGD